MARSAINVELFAGQVPVIDRPMAIVRLSGAPQSQAVRHNILVLDCSMSMTSSIEEVKNHARQFVSELDAHDHVSIVVFSGHNTARQLCGPVACDGKGKQKLDATIRDQVYIMNTTVFSEPLELVLHQLHPAKHTNMAHQAILFTDGCAVPTRWSRRAEEDRALIAAKSLYNFGAAVSVIGYGFHYDADFVSRLMQAAGSSGIFRHMNDVDDFAEVIRDIRDTFARVTLSDIELTLVIPNTEVKAVYRALPEVTCISNSNSIVNRGLIDGAVTYYIELSKPLKKTTVTGSLGDNKIVYTSAPIAMSTEQQLDCIRLIAAHAALIGNAQYAIELLQQTDDEGVAETLAEAHTEREQRTNRDRLRRAFRNKQFIGTGLKPTGPSHCVINVLRVLMEDPSVVISLPTNGYVRGGLLKRDPRIVESPLGRTLRVVNYASKQDRWNFSLTAKKNVKVLPIDGDGNIIPDGTPVDSTIFRTYNIVRDGELVMPSLLTSMSEHSFTQLQEAGVIDAKKSYKAGASYELRLADMKVVSSAWARPSNLKLVDLLTEEAELAAEQKALRAAIQAMGAPEVTDFDEQGGYRDKTEAVATNGDMEYYTAPCMELRLMKYKPQDYSKTVAKLDKQQASDRLTEVRRRLRTVRFIARSITFACELTGWRTVNWGAPKQTARSKNPKVEYLARLDGHELKRVIWETEVAYS